MFQTPTLKSDEYHVDSGHITHQAPPHYTENLSVRFKLLTVQG